LALIGAVLVLISAFVGWYQVSLVGPGVSATQTYLPGNSGYASCTGSGSIGSTPCTSGGGSVTYTSVHENETGLLYEAVQALCLLAFAAGAGGGLMFLLLSKRRPETGRYGFGLVALAVLVGLIAPLAVLAAQTSTLTADMGGTAASTGPSATFYGSDSTASTTLTWGPWIGWYFALVGAVVLLVAAALIGLKRRAEAPPESEGEDAGSFDDGPGAPASPDTYSMDRPYGSGEDDSPQPPPQQASMGSPSIQSLTRC
jgi:hypothetical protein